MAQLGSAPRSGRGGRKFKSCYPDQDNPSGLSARRGFTFAVGPVPSAAHQVAKLGSSSVIGSRLGFDGFFCGPSSLHTQVVPKLWAMFGLRVSLLRPIESRRASDRQRLGRFLVMAGSFSGPSNPDIRVTGSTRAALGLTERIKPTAPRVWSRGGHRRFRRGRRGRRCRSTGEPGCHRCQAR